MKDTSRYTTQKHPSDKHKFLILDHKEETAKSFRVKGYMCYIRMTERAESIGGIYLPEKSRDDSITIYEIISIGEKVNTYRPYSLMYKNIPHFQRNPVTNFDVGDIIIIPEKATSESSGYMRLVKRSIVSDYEGFIDCGLILAKVNTPDESDGNINCAGDYYQNNTQGATEIGSKCRIPLANGSYFEGYIRGGIITET